MLMIQTATQMREMTCRQMDVWDINWSCTFYDTFLSLTYSVWSGLVIWCWCCRLTHLRELLSKLVQFLLQRGLLLLGGGHLVTDLTDLSGDASCHGNTSGFPSSNVGALNTKWENSSASLKHGVCLWDRLQKCDGFSDPMTLAKMLWKKTFQTFGINSNNLTFHDHFQYLD